MVKREAVARFPEPHYTTRQYSSYDRNATKPGDSTWFANWDRSQFIRIEQNQGRKEYVMLDQEGPGAIVRFWMTFAGEGGGRGTLRVYFDNEEEPTIEGTAFEVLSGGLLVGVPLSASVSPKTDYEIRGHNLYLPLPFSQHCKITYQSENIKDMGAKSGGENVYYNINYREYESGTNVETFTQNQLDKAQTTIQQVQQKLKERDKEVYIASLLTTSDSLSKTLAEGQTITQSLEGPAAIRKIAVTIEADNPEQALRSTVLELSFDGKRTAWVPVGYFFGTGYQYRKSNTWYTTVTEEGSLKAYWVMPFEEQAEVIFRNVGKQRVSITSRIVYSDWNWGRQSMHFGSSWHQYTDLQTGGQKNMSGGGGPFDINFTRLSGHGVYVGDALTLFNTAYAWWGEGDEKIYIDGEEFPSHFGTGTEDYYGYAWVRPEVFTNHPFISQPDGSGNITPGYTVNQRYRSLDAIPFKKELIFDMEMWHWAKTVIDYAPTTFFYLRPDGKVLADPDVKSAKESVSLKRSDIISPRVRKGKIEGEKLIIESLTGGNIKFQFLKDPSLSNDKQLWWRAGTEGDILEAFFVADKEGTFQASACFVAAPDYGVVQISLNGQTILKEFNAYNDTLSEKVVDLGKLDIQKGKNEIQITIVGQSPKSGDAMFGLDYIQFERPNTR
ncbi:MAG TPA: glycoside hydrolase family 172 protein [Fodinibius sp.]|nr:glycoside hydrolase family 172 protein [Fodinibius sp.]